MAQPIKSLALHYPMIQFLIIAMLIYSGVMVIPIEIVALGVISKNCFRWLVKTSLRLASQEWLGC